MSNYLGLDFITDFWCTHYIGEYISGGGSKIKFITGREGSGKSSLLHVMRVTALGSGYQVAALSADSVWMNDFREIYCAVLAQCDLDLCLHGCADQIISNMGYDPSEIPEGYSFMDYLSARGENTPIVKREIREQLKKVFLQNGQLDNNFALAFSLLTGGVLGHPVLERQNRDILLQWLYGDKTIKSSVLRGLGLSPTKITKFNARYMLRSLSEVLHISGCSGLLVTVDNLDALLNLSGSSDIAYTKMKREDTYESIRQLIDDIDSMHNIMFLFAFDRILMDDDRNGLKSYQALWMRIQSEVSGTRFNRFADIVDLDKMEAQVFDPDLIVKISENIILETDGVPTPLDHDQAAELLRRSRTGAFGLPQLIRNAVLGGNGNV